MVLQQMLERLQLTPSLNVILFMALVRKSLFMTLIVTLTCIDNIVK